MSDAKAGRLVVVLVWYLLKWISLKVFFGMWRSGDIQRVLTEVGEVLLVAGPSVSTLVVLKQNSIRIVCNCWQYYLNSLWLNPGQHRIGSLSRLAAMEEAKTNMPVIIVIFRINVSYCEAV